jgi:hypothetical protein
MRVVMKLFLIIVTLIPHYGCFTQRQAKPKEPVRSELIPKEGDIAASPVVEIKTPQSKKASSGFQEEDITGVATPPMAVDATGDCEFNELLSSVPGFVSQLQVVVTRVNQPCLAEEEKPGYKPDSAWMAMGVPCTAGKGRYTIRGKSYRPKMIVYHLENDCPMAPASAQQLKLQVGELDQKFLRPEKLLALTPFNLLYWESADYPDAGVGPNIGMLSRAYLKEGWKRFRTGDVLKFRLYGQENAWVTDKRFYAIDAEIKVDARKFFQLNLVTVVPMSDEDLEKIHERCERLRPRRSCKSLEKR